MVSIVNDSLQVIEEPDIPGWFSIKQLNFLYSCIEYSGAKNCLEIGTYMGRSAFAICTALKKFNGDKLVCVDTFTSPLSNSYFQTPFMTSMLSRLPSNIVTQYTDHESLPTTLDCFKHTMKRFPFMKDLVKIKQGDSKKVDLGSEIFDFLLLDGDHTYEGVRADFEHVLPHTKDGSVIVFDDCSEHFPGVQKFVDEIMNSSLPTKFLGQVHAALAIQITKQQ